MDNLTHSLIGALLGQAGLKRLTGLGTAALVIGANIPDIDGACMLLGTQQLALRRGITHGPPAILLLSGLVAIGLIAFDRWQARRGTRPDARLPVRPGWLFLLALVGTLSHPLFDWMNSYGVRFLTPFSWRWFYGDTLFIIDMWLWIGMLAAVIWCWRKAVERPARIALTAVSAYLIANDAITGQAEAQGAQAVAARHGAMPDLVVGNPLPVTFWQREVLWQGAIDGVPHVGFGRYDALASPALVLEGLPIRTNMADPRIEAARVGNADLDAFLIWARMPYATFEERDGDIHVIVRDARFANPMVRDRFTIDAIVPSN